jgi:hypothetical protein
MATRIAIITAIALMIGCDRQAAEKRAAAQSAHRPATNQVADRDNESYNEENVFEMQHKGAIYRLWSDGKLFSPGDNIDLYISINDENKAIDNLTIELYSTTLDGFVSKKSLSLTGAVRKASSKYKGGVYVFKNITHVDTSRSILTSTGSHGIDATVVLSSDVIGRATLRITVK